MPAHRGAGIRHLHSNTILNVVVEIASFFVFAYASSTSTTKLITCIERTKNLEKSVSSRPLLKMKYLVHYNYFFKWQIYRFIFETE